MHRDGRISLYSPLATLYHDHICEGWQESRGAHKPANISLNLLNSEGEKATNIMIAIANQ
jgi:hypothetical protein